MEQSKERASDERNTDGIGDGCQEAIGDERIQADLLEQAERHVAKEAFRVENVVERVVRAAEKQTCGDDCKRTGKEDQRSAFSGTP